MKILPKTLALITAIGALVILSGCASPYPTKLEGKFADIETNYVPRLVLVTNFVQVPTPVFYTNQIVQFTTNEQQRVVTVLSNVVNQIWVTNTVPQLSASTNLEPVYVERPNATSKAIASGAGTIANTFLPGTGTLVTGGILGLLSIFLGYRNRQFAGQNDALSQAAGVLTQIIETGREIMATTPQGQQAANQFTAWLVSHQAETQTIGTITKIVQDVTDNDQAKAAAEQILKLINQPTAPAKV